MGVSLKFTPDIINKDLEISKISTEEGFKFKLCDKGDVFVVVLILSLFKADGIIEKYGSKKDIVYSCYA